MRVCPSASIVTLSGARTTVDQVHRHRVLAEGHIGQPADKRHAGKAQPDGSCGPDHCNHSLVFITATRSMLSMRRRTRRTETRLAASTIRLARAKIGASSTSGTA
jgi:hypothetical protein